MIRTAAHAFTHILAGMSMTAVLLLPAVLLEAQAVASANVEVLYAPNDAPLDRIVTLYQGAKRYIYVSVYGFTILESRKHARALSLSLERSCPLCNGREMPLEDCGRMR